MYVISSFPNSLVVFCCPALTNVLFEQRNRVARRGEVFGENCVQGLREWREDTDTKRVCSRTRMGWAKLRKNEINMDVLWVYFHGGRGKGKYRLYRFIFYKETELENTAHMVIVLWVDLAAVWNTFSVKNIQLDQIKCYQISSIFSIKFFSNSEVIIIFF